MIIYTIIITVALIATIKRYRELNKKYLLQQGTIFTLETRNNKVLEKLKELESWKAPHKSKSNDNFFKNKIDYKDGYFYADLAAEKSDIYEFSFDVDFNYMLEEAKQKDYILIKEL